MNLLEAQTEMLCNIEAGNATMLQSGSGMGKSSIIKQTFDMLAAGAAPGEWGFGISFAATMSPIDTLGVPFKGTHEFDMPDGTRKSITVTDPSVPLWMISTEGKPAFCYKKFFLFIDEYGQGEADTKRGLSEIFLSGGNGHWHLPVGSVRVAATNVGSRYGVTKDFDFAIARRTLVKVEGNVDVTTKYLDKPYQWQGETWQTLPVVKAWINSPNGLTFLFEEEPKEQGPWCNPRTLCAADRYLQRKAARNNGVVPTDPITMETLTGTIGQGACTSLISHLQFLLDLPSYDKVVADPLKCEIPKKADLKLLMAYELAAKVKVEHLSEVLTYMSRQPDMPKDMCVTFITALLRRDYKTLMAQPAMQAWINKNASLVSIISSLS